MISKQQIDDFERLGAICIRSLLSSAQIEVLEKGIEANLKSLSPRAKVASSENDPGWFVEDFCTWQDNPFYKEIIFESELAMVAGTLTKSQKVRLFHDHMLVKEPGTRQHTPWHQDQPYYNIEGRQNLSMWIPVDKISLASTLEFVAGSHHGPWLMPRSFLDGKAKWFPEGSLCDLPDIDANRDQYEILAWEMNPGDVVCFHMLTLHAAGAVSGKTRRRVFSIRFLGDDIVHQPRQWVTSPDFPGLKEDLPEGSPMDHELFPILWTSDS